MGVGGAYSKTTYSTAREVVNMSIMRLTILKLQMPRAEALRTWPLYQVGQDPDCPKSPRGPSQLLTGSTAYSDFAVANTRPQYHLHPLKAPQYSKHPWLSSYHTAPHQNMKIKTNMKLLRTLPLPQKRTSG